MFLFLKHFFSHVSITPKKNYNVIHMIFFLCYLVLWMDIKGWWVYSKQVEGSLNGFFPA